MEIQELLNVNDQSFIFEVYIARDMLFFVLFQQNTLRSKTAEEIFPSADNFFVFTTVQPYLYTVIVLAVFLFVTIDRLYSFVNDFITLYIATSVSSSKIN